MSNGKVRLVVKLFFSFYWKVLFFVDFLVDTLL